MPTRNLVIAATRFLAEFTLSKVEGLEMTEG